MARAKKDTTKKKSKKDTTKKKASTEDDEDDIDIDEDEDDIDDADEEDDEDDEDDDDEDDDDTDTDDEDDEDDDDDADDEEDDEDDEDDEEDVPVRRLGDNDGDAIEMSNGGAVLFVAPDEIAGPMDVVIRIDGPVAIAVCDISKPRKKSKAGNPSFGTAGGALENAYNGQTVIMNTTPYSVTPPSGKRGKALSTVLAGDRPRQYIDKADWDTAQDIWRDAGKKVTKKNEKKLQKLFAKKD